VENYGRAFSDMHGELYQVYVNGDIVVVQLALQGTHHGALAVGGGGVLEPTGNRMDAPCCDVFELEDGKIKRFNCYPSGPSSSPSSACSATSTPPFARRRDVTVAELDVGRTHDPAPSARFHPRPPVPRITGIR
jgi:hypothetical protein